MPIDHNFRRRRVQALIDRDPWTVTYTSRGATSLIAETTGTFTARLFPAIAYRGASKGLGIDGSISSEVATHVLLATDDTPELKNGDTVRCVHDESGITRRLNVTYARRAAYKWEIEVDEVG